MLALCSRCGQCMKVCPTNIIQPAVVQAGPDGLFTPRMDFQAGQCEWSCNECGKVCPTGAIEPLQAITALDQPIAQGNVRSTDGPRTQALKQYAPDGDYDGSQVAFRNTEAQADLTRFLEKIASGGDDLPEVAP